MSLLFEAANVSKHYVGVQALSEASLSLAVGEVHALVGENGAGKSTLAKVIAGAVVADTGQFLIDGHPVSITNPHDAQRLGIGMIYQELDLFPNLTVGENIVVGNLRYREGSVVDFAAMERYCRPFLEQVGLETSVRRTVSRLSIGERQLLAIARALSMEARIILMDEPTSSLFDDAAERLFRLIAGLKQRGVSIVYVSHKMDEIFRLCDRLTVMRDGRTIETVETDRTNANEVIRLMVGRSLTLTERRNRPAPNNIALSVRQLTTDKLHDVSFDLHYGEVLGVAGLVGSGRSELLGALFGLETIRSGTVSPTPARSPWEAMMRGIGLLPEDRRLEGLMMQMSVRENITIAALGGLQRGGFVQPRKEHRCIEPLRRQLDLRYHSSESAVRNLSGGNQQKALLARWLLREPRILLLDDPTRGIDVGAKHDIYRLIDELAAAGKAIILVSSELPELLRCCDRIAVLNQGRLSAIYDTSDASQERILAAATAQVN